MRILTTKIIITIIIKQHFNLLKRKKKSYQTFLKKNNKQAHKIKLISKNSIKIIINIKIPNLKGIP